MADLIIAKLKISSWSGRRFDRKVTREVNAAHGTKDAGRFNKILIDKSRIASITKAAGKIRNCHIKNTLPWDHKGGRLLPMGSEGFHFFEYTGEMSRLIAEFNEEVEEFCTDFESLVSDAKSDLNGLFNPMDYPSKEEIRSKFEAGVEYTPKPEENDFRRTLTTDSVLNDLEANLKAQMVKKHENAVSSMFARVKTVLDRIIKADPLSRKDGEREKFFKATVFGEIAHIIKVFPTLNFTGNVKLAHMIKEMESLMLDDPLELRKDTQKKRRYVDRAKELEKMFF